MHELFIKEITPHRIGLVRYGVVERKEVRHENLQKAVEFCPGLP